MAYTPYATYSDYQEMGLDVFGEEADVNRALTTASRHIDTLTFNRIVAAGFDKLTEFQQAIIKEVACRLALFEHENADQLDAMLNSYSINGVSVNYGDSAGVKTVDGVTIPRSLYSFLEQTGLTCRLARYIWPSIQS